jgi:excinuclease UvrABC ATPase subunit
LRFEADLVVPDKTLSLRQGAIVPWAKTGNTSPYYTQTLEAVCKHYGAAMSTPWDELDDEVRNAILFGTMDEEITFVYDDGLRTYKTTKPFEGVIGNIERRWQETDSSVGARRAVAVPVRPPVPVVQWLSSQAPGAGGQGQWPAHCASIGNVDPGSERLVQRPARPP